MPELVVAAAAKPSDSTIRALSASQALTNTSGASPWCNARRRTALSRAESATLGTGRNDDSLSCRTDRRAKRHVHTIMGVDCRDGDGKVHEFLVRKVLSDQIINVIGHAASHEIRDRFRPSQSRALARAEDIAGFTPDRNEMETFLGLADGFPFGHVQVEAEGATVHLRRANVDEVLEARFEAACDRFSA